MEFIEYEKCSTCRKAKKFLEENDIKYKDRNIIEDNINEKEIDLILSFGININKLFNTSGLIYRKLKLKDKIKTISMEEKKTLLINNPMLVKRPILLDKNSVLIGFKLDEWKKLSK